MPTNTNPDEAVSVEECALPSGMSCLGGWHFREGIAVRRCDALRRQQIRARIDGELQRLAGARKQLEPWGALDASGIPVFDGYRTDRHEGAERGLAVMRAFSAARPPSRGVLIVGSNGLGKTRLLLASHFALLAAGIASQYVTTPELRFWFRRQLSFDEEISREARGWLDRLLYAQVVHFDDPGHVEDDQRARGEFTEGLKQLLDNSRAVWAVASNRSSVEMERHPDLSGSVASRFQYGAEVIVMRGLDFRVEMAR